MQKIYLRKRSITAAFSGLIWGFLQLQAAHLHAGVFVTHKQGLFYNAV
jgi:hypothetical protein